MIEELTAILNLLGDITGIAAWVLGGFIVYKSVIYLATAGMIYKLISMAVDKLYSAFKLKVEEPNIKVTEHFNKLRDITCGEHVAEGVINLLKKVRKHNIRNRGPNEYSDFFINDLTWLERVVDEAIEKETKQ